MGGNNFYYDKNGNLTDDGSYLYYYDCENRLVDVNDGSDNPVLSFTYDYMGRRVRKATYYNGDVNEMTRFVYDGQQVIAEYDYNDTTAQYELARKFIHGDGIDQPICMINSAAPTGTYYYHYDGLGSVAALTDTAGNLKERYTYDVFGEATIYNEIGSVISVSSVANPYYFTGRRYDKEADFYYYRARYYKPEIGRFLQTDPIHYWDSLNIYTYVHNNPITNIDPRGLSRKVYRMPGIIPPRGGRGREIIGPYPFPIPYPEPPKKGDKCCKSYAPSMAEKMGVSVWECANMILDEAWEPIGGPGTGIIGGIIGIIYPPVGIGIGIGGGAQLAIAIDNCSRKECEEYGNLNECGKCK